MAVTRSTAADRRRQETSPLGRGMVVPGFGGAPVRDRETVLLAAGALVVLLGLILVYLATVKPLDGVAQKLASGEIVNLNALRGSEQLLPVLDAFDSSAERSFVAQEIWKRAHLGKLPNVGELSRIRVQASDIERDKRLTGFRERLETARRRAGYPIEDTAAPRGAYPGAVPLLVLALDGPLPARLRGAPRRLAGTALRR
jgi:hypothetical protein